jgi:glutathione S-transferase
MIQIYGFPNTRSTRAVWALEEAGAEYGYTAVDLTRGEHRKPEFLKVNPGGKVPVLIDGDLVLTESAAICTYIGEKFPSSNLVPVRADDRAYYFQWCFFAMSELETPLWTMAKYTRLLPEERRVPAVAETCVWEFHRAAHILAQHMEGREYAVGGKFTAADILLGGTLNWARKSSIALNSEVLETYAERMATRPTLVRAREREAKAAG